MCSAQLVLTLKGFVRYGNIYHPFGLACVMSNTVATNKRMYVGAHHAGEEWSDVLGWCLATVIIDGRGFGIFPVAGKSIGVWVNAKAKGRKSLSKPL
jgi:alpha-amylase